jgi:hypothetical protein
MANLRRDRVVPQEFVRDLREMHRTFRFTLVVVLVFVLALIVLVIRPDSLGPILDFLREVVL